MADPRLYGFPEMPSDTGLKRDRPGRESPGQLSAETSVRDIAGISKQMLKKLVKQSIITGKHSDFVSLLTHQFFVYIISIFNILDKCLRRDCFA